MSIIIINTLFPKHRHLLEKPSSNTVSVSSTPSSTLVSLSTSLSPLIKSPSSLSKSSSPSPTPVSIPSLLSPTPFPTSPSSVCLVSTSSSRSPTPVSSVSSAPGLSDISPRSSLVISRPPIFEAIPWVESHLEARDILTLSATTRQFRNLRTSHAFTQHLQVNGWDTNALVQRAELAKDSKGRPWMFLARSALAKGDIASAYASLPKEGEKPSSKGKKAAERFFRALVDVATEHDRRNFETLAALAAAQDLSLIQFVGNVHAHDWKTRYRKTFVVGAYINSQPPQPDVEGDLEALAATLDFDHAKPPLSLVAARANFLYAYGCTYSALELGAAHAPVPPTVYDAPALRTARGTALPGVRAALERFAQRTAIRGFYRRTGGAATALHMAFEPLGLASRSRLPFAEKDLLKLTATLTDGDGNAPWDIQGTFDRKTGVGKFTNATEDMSYDFWITPWGLTGEKIRGESKHLGYFVLQWT